MSGYSQRVAALRDRARAAQEHIADVPEAEWTDSDVRERFESVLAYAQSVLEATDGALLSAAASNAVDAVLTEAVNDPSTILADAESWGDRVLDALAPLPVSRGREVEQVVKDAAATFQRSAQQRLEVLRADFETAKRRLDEIATQIQQQDEALRENVEERRTEFVDEITRLQADFAERLDAYSTTLREEQDALASLRSTQRAAFEESEEQRSRAARTRLDDADEQLRAFQSRVTEEVERRVAEIRRMEEESAQLVGAIGLAGTAERYAEEVRDQREVADKWRIATVVFAVIAVGGALFALAQSDQGVEHLVAKLAFSVIVGGIAAYTARQSSYHRQREQRARDLQLELTAFSPFIEQLSLEQQEEERVIMTRKTFGKTTQGAAPEEEPGPTALSLMLRNKQAQQQAAQDGGAPV